MARFVPFAYGFRPLFLLAGLDAIVNMGVWLAVYFRPEYWPKTAIAPMYWHGHEMLFGFVAAAVGGFLLTAVPGWTGRRPFAGTPLVVLVAIWLAGRIAMAPFCGIEPVSAAVIDLAFFPALVLALAPPLIRAGKLRNLPFVLLLAILFFANLVFHLGGLELFEGGEPIGLGIAVDIVIILIVVVGGRIIPGFTRNGLAAQGIAIEIAPRRWLDMAAIATVVAVIAGDLVASQSAANGAVALLAAVVQFARLLQWRGHRAWRNPLIWVLHVGYGWLAIGLGLKGVWLVTGAEFSAKWLHAITAGAFATMILAVMTRAALGHTGRALVAARPIVASYILLTLAAAIRVFGPAISPAGYDMTIGLAGAGWIAAFGLFVLVYTPILILSRIDGREG